MTRLLPPSMGQRTAIYVGTLRSALGIASSRQPPLQTARLFYSVLSLWLVLGFAISIRTIVSPEKHTVFPIFAASATHWWQDQPLYTRYADLDDYFRYPPVFAIALTPFNFLGLTAGGILWTWLSLAVYAAGLWYFACDVIPISWTPPRLAVFFALGVFGALRGLWKAQSNALVIGLLLLAVAALMHRRWWSAAGFLGGSVLLKLTPLAPALLLCALWPRRLIGRFLLVLLVGLLVPFLTRPPEIAAGHYQEWLEHLLSSSQERWPGFRDGWTAWLALRHQVTLAEGPVPLRAPIDALWYRVLQIVGAAGTLAWCLWQRRQGISRKWLVTGTLALGLAWLMLLGPAAEHATYVFLTPVLVWAWLERDIWPRGRWLITGATLLILVLGWGTVTRPLLSVAPIVLAALPLGTLLFILWLLGATLACQQQRGHNNDTLPLDVRHLLQRQHQRMRPLAAPALGLHGEVELVRQRQAG